MRPLFLNRTFHLFTRDEYNRRIWERDIINQDITEVIINHGIHGNTTIETIEIIIETIGTIEMDPDTFGFCLMTEHLDLV